MIYESLYFSISRSFFNIWTICSRISRGKTNRFIIENIAAKSRNFNLYASVIQGKLFDTVRSNFRF